MNIIENKIKLGDIFKLINISIKVVVTLLGFLNLGL